MIGKDLIEVRQLISKGLLDEALSLAENIKDPYWRGYALKWIAQAYAERGSENALSIALRIPVTSLRNDALWMVSYIFSKKGKFKLSITAARNITNQYLRKKTMRFISNSIAKMIVEKGVSEVRLSDLELDERDIEELKPFPYGIVYKDKKLLVGADIHRIKGEVKHGILALNTATASSQKTPSNHVISDTIRRKKVDEQEQYIIQYIKRLIEKGDLENAYSLALGLSEHYRSALLEEIGLAYLELSCIEKAEKVFKKCPQCDSLAIALLRIYVQRGDLKKALWVFSKIKHPEFQLFGLYDIFRAWGFRGEFIQFFQGVSEYKMGRLLKFIAFELLNEAKLNKNEKLLRLSKEVFEKGKEYHRKCL
ncbi:hypothetical protein TBCH5v1_0299 [Thermococcus barophilus]|uniref:Uncharacterized protein n=2 Tax=Thermococcus barophilus TaxID=55802 RepID=A0A0S1X903_THEBA|nr:hypothetical protein TBCH5v1_0299 [Thermococcus barophilus]